MVGDHSVVTDDVDHQAAAQELAARLVGAYDRRLAPAFVRRVLEEELRRGPAAPVGTVEDSVHRLLDAWLELGRYPLPD
jgi:ABC-type nitrate/sulfonate/bicarbonate transport system substrate-binding protein